MKKLSDIFDTWYGVNLELVNCDIVPNGIPFVSRSGVGNGVVARVSKIDGIKPNPAHTLSLAGGGSVLSCFYQDEEYYSGRDLFILSPKEPMTKCELLLYSYIIGINRYKYNYGRQANRTFRDILLPDLSEIKNINIENVNVDYSFNKGDDCNPLSIDTENWHNYRYDEIFQICKGFYNKKPEMSSSEDYPFIGATDSNNGKTGAYSLQDIEEASKTGVPPNQTLEEKIFKGNCITVSNNGSVGYAFYQTKDFTCSHDVNPLYIHEKWKQDLNPYIAMFLCALIQKERYRWNYGRKWRPIRMPSSIIKLPSKLDENGEFVPDWQFMESYIKSLPYSVNL